MKASEVIDMLDDFVHWANGALDYLRNTYAVRITSVGELVRVKAEAHAPA